MSGRISEGFGVIRNFSIHRFFKDWQRIVLLFHTVEIVDHGLRAKSYFRAHLISTWCVILYHL